VKTIAIASPWIEPALSADFDKWTVKWDGTHQTFGNLGHHFTDALLHDTYKGRTHALSLVRGPSR